MGIGLFPPGKPAVLQAADSAAKCSSRKSILPFRTRDVSQRRSSRSEIRGPISERRPLRGKIPQQVSRRERPSLVVETSQRAVTFQALAQRGAGYAKKLRGPDLVAVRLAHRPQRKLPLKPRQQLDRWRRTDAASKSASMAFSTESPLPLMCCSDETRGDLPKRDILRQEHVRGRQNGSSLNSVFQFADVSRPRIRLQHTCSFLR